MKIIRVFPSRTTATPRDRLAYVGDPPPSFQAGRDGADLVMVSCVFSWDRREAERLARVWGEKCGCPVEIGGPAFGDPGGEFVPGQFLKPGYVIASRGCPNSCWFCDVPKREGPLRELPVTYGHNILDSNLLACSPAHQEAVFSMLARQKKRPLFTGGLEAKRITPEIAQRLRKIRTDRLFCAYDTPDDLEPLIEAGKILQSAGFTRSHHLYAYVLCGFPKDTEDAFYRRRDDTWEAGFMPVAMAWRGPDWINWPGIARTYSRSALARRMLSV